MNGLGVSIVLGIVGAVWLVVLGIVGAVWLVVLAMLAHRERARHRQETATPAAWAHGRALLHSNTQPQKGRRTRERADAPSCTESKTTPCPQRNQVS